MKTKASTIGTLDPSKIRPVLERLLFNIVDFWQQRAIDSSVGGYQINYDGRGRALASPEMFLVAQARTLWYFSRLAQSPYGAKDHVAAARHGWTFLRESMWDSAYGGFYWSVGADGERARDGKHLYGQAFALFAISEYAKATNDADAKAFVQTFFKLLDDRAHDPQHGGYDEFFSRDWSASTMRGYLGHLPSIKSVNTHLHLLEAVMAYASLVPEPLALVRMQELVDILCSKAVHSDPETGAYGVERHHSDWSALDEPIDCQASYGHDVELAWFLLDARERLNSPRSQIPTLLFRHALSFGFDRRRGGFYESGIFGRPARRRGKVWWTQAEGLLGLLKMYLATQDTTYAACFTRMLDWIVRSQVDWRHGEWYPMVSAFGRKSGDKGGPWKSPYHEARAVLSCLELLPDALGTSC